MNESCFVVLSFSVPQVLSEAPWVLILPVLTTLMLKEPKVFVSVYAIHKMLEHSHNTIRYLHINVQTIYNTQRLNTIDKFTAIYLFISIHTTINSIKYLSVIYIEWQHYLAPKKCKKYIIIINT